MVKHIAEILDKLIYHVEITEPSIIWISDKLAWIARKLAKQGVVIQDELWIDVRDHLPTSDGRFMVTIKNKGKAHVEMRNFHANTKTWCNDTFWDTDNVIAWQPRPKPFAPVISGQSNDETN